jgi:tRNA(fMet)-specific endonuclease VapC
MAYLLDTSACVDAIKNRFPFVRRRFVEAVRAGELVFASAIVSFELHYGAAKSASSVANTRVVHAFLRDLNGLLPFDEEDSVVAARLRAQLEALGKPIGAYDLLIAAQALRREMILVTSNVKELSRVRGLQWQDWARA